MTMKRLTVFLMSLALLLSLSSCFVIPHVPAQDFAMLTVPEGGVHTGTLVVVNAANRHKDFAHMAHVENTASLAHSIVFVCNIGILKRHLKTAERHHLGAQLYMCLVETGSLV